mgnify:CR=1 FL=1
MKVVIAGGTTFDSIDHMNICLDDIVDDIETVVSGRGYGADALAEVFAIQNALDLELYPANWGRYGANAGYNRWVKVFETQNIEQVFLFWDGKSSGTRTLKKLCEQFEIPFEMFYYECE